MWVSFRTLSTIFNFPEYSVSDNGSVSFIMAKYNIFLHDSFFTKICNDLCNHKWFLMEAKIYPTTYSIFLTIYDLLNSFTTSASHNKKYDDKPECNDYQIRPNKLSHLCWNIDYSDRSYGFPYSRV